MRASLRRMLAIAAKEYTHIRRDPRMLFAVLGMPILQLLLFSYAISFDVRDVPTVILDADRTSASREYVTSFERSDFFDVIGYVESMRAIDEVFDRSEAKVALVVAPGFAEQLDRGEKGRVSVLIDGSEPNAAQLGQTYAVTLNRSLDREVLVEWAQRRGLDTARFGAIDPRLRTWYNPERRSADFLVPGMMVVIIMIVTIQQTAVTLVREKEQGTFEQIAVSPIRRGEVMIGKVAPWVLLAFADMLAITIVALTVFRTPLRGDVLGLAAGTVLFVLCCLAIGLVISALSSSVEVANITGLLVSFLPGFMLSGFAFPLNSIPVVLRGVSYLFPGRYMILIARGIFLKGAGFSGISSQLGALALYALISLTLASLLYARKAD